MTATAPANAPADPVRVRQVAAEADARAAEARAAADRAKAAAKAAAKQAAQANARAAELRTAADPEARERADLTVEQAKARLLEAARAIDPVGHTRQAIAAHPWAVVGTAAGAGVVLGSTGGILTSGLKSIAILSASLVKLAKPLTLAAGQYAATRMAAQHAAEATTENVTGRPVN